MWINPEATSSALVAAVGATVLTAAVLTADPIKPGANAGATAMSEVDVSVGVPLNEVADPSHTLSAATVQTSKGEKIGEVRAVEMGPDGAPKAVNVSTTGLLGLGTLTKSIKASDLIYVRHRNVLVSRLTKAEIDALPSTAQQKKKKA